VNLLRFILHRNIIYILCFFIAGCALNLSSKDLYVALFTGKGGMQYYLKPLEFKSSDGNLILMDITFKDHSSDSSFATINLSFIYPKRSEVVDSVLFIDSNNELIFSINNGQLMFNKPYENKSFLSRYTFNGSFQDINNLFGNNIFTLKNGKRVYKQTKRTNKKIITLQNKLFFIFDDKVSNEK